MNLSDDVAQWTAWQLVLRNTDTGTFVSSILLRRECIPPLLDTAQDLLVSVRLEQGAVSDGVTRGFGNLEPGEVLWLVTSLSCRVVSQKMLACW